MSSITSKLKKIYKHNIDIQELEAVSNESGSIIFALYKKDYGREPYNNYILLIKKKIYLIRAETFYDVKKENDIVFLSACFFNKDRYDPFYQTKIINIKQIIDIANQAFFILSNKKMKFDFNLPKIQKLSKLITKQSSQ